MKNITVQEFQYNQFIQLISPTLIVNGQSIPANVTFRNMRNSGSANLTDYPVASVGIGCLDSDWANFTADFSTVAVIARNDLVGCPIQTKIDLALKYNASAVLMYTTPGSVLFQGGIEVQPPNLPCFSMVYELGMAIVNMGPTGRVSIFSHNSAFPLTSKNIIADISKGDPSNTIVVGSHLDSVEEGPGINDNGSGSSAILGSYYFSFSFFLE